MDKLIPEVRDRLRALALNTVYWPHKAETILEKDFPAFYRFAAETIGSDNPVNYLEFGVAHGKSFRTMVGLFTNERSRFVGFDSFIGLPEDWLMHKKGAFSNGGHPPRIDDSRVSFVGGWFQNTVPGFFESYPLDKSLPTLIHFDCDLYSSALFLLTTLWHHIDEYYFIFDDFIHDENVAVYDFMNSFPVEIKFIAQTRGGGPGPNPDQVFGHIKRTKLVIDGV